MQEFNTPKTGEGASPANSLAFHMAGYRAGLAEYLAITNYNTKQLEAEKARLVDPHEDILVDWDAPASGRGEALVALRLLRDEIEGFEPTPICAPLLAAALGFFEREPRVRNVDASGVYWIMREALGLTRLIQSGLDLFLEVYSPGSEEAGRLRDMEQASVVASRTLERALEALGELEKLEVVGGAA